MNHLVLLGDSIFDNGVYVRTGEPDVIQQVKEKLPDGWQGTLCAVDGDRIGDIASQLAKVPAGATHFAVSVGGNDTLDQIGLLSESARSVAEVLERLAEVSERFQANYHRMLHQVLERGLPTLVCTVYEGNMEEAHHRKIAATALKVFNDAILREAIVAKVPVLDLRLVCSRPEDYANPIEPSAVGGAKIAAGILHVMTTHGFGKGQQIYW